MVEPRTATSVGFAVVLGGGAGLGAYEIGVIDALARQGVRPDLVVGTSVGALNAAYWAFNASPDVGEQLLQAWLDSARPGVFVESPWKWVRRLVAHHDHLFGHSAQLSLISRRLGDGLLIEDAAIPLAIVATDVDSSERVVLRRGNLTTALLASIAIPGLYSPVRVNGHLLVDGGVVANCDLDAVVEAGLDAAVVVDPMGTSTAPARGDLVFEFEHAIAASMRRQTDLAIRSVRDRLKVVLLRPTLGWSPRLLDFSHTNELFEMGRAAVGELVLASVR
jgi:NTE family protein